MRSLLSGLLILLCCLASPAQADDALDGRIDQGIRDLDAGHFELALDVLNPAYAQSRPGQQQARAANALGLVHLRMHDAAKAEPLLHKAFDVSTDPLQRARYAVDLANLYVGQGKIQQGKDYYAEALKLVPEDESVAVSVGLNLARLDAQGGRLARLAALSVRLAKVADIRDRARFSLNLGVQARELGRAGLRLGYESFETARALAAQIKDGRLEAEALDQLAQLYEDQGRINEALQLSETAIAPAESTESHDILIRIEWRRGRLLRKQDKLDLATAAYRSAVYHIETIRQDIPVEYQDGRSSFRTTLEPIYLGLADLLLQQSGKVEGERQADLLRQARSTVELIKQAELDDFLGDRCTVGSIRSSGDKEVIPAHTAVLYPIIFPERLELLVETSAGMQRRTVPISASDLGGEARQFASFLRARLPYKALSRRLYNVLLQPVDGLFASEQVDTVVVVPDGVLRLLPFGALNDGHRFAIEKYAIAVAPGLTMTDTSASKARGRDLKTLLAGVSEPGAAVEKLPSNMVAQILPGYGQFQAEAADRKINRSLFTRGLLSRGLSETQSQEAQGGKTQPMPSKAEGYKELKEMLELPGVKDEIQSLGKIAPGKTLLNNDFSVAAFSSQVTSGDYRILHIASHGVFGGTADSTFIMAHDGLITIDKLQDFLRTEGTSEHPIELLTLSACETAEGDDRAPLGLSGAALKARARTALGSLWPVSDEASKMLMVQFYRGLYKPGMSKVKALQQAQVKLIGEKEFTHPYFWAPFILVGSWL